MTTVRESQRIEHFEKLLKQIKGELGLKTFEKFGKQKSIKENFEFVWNLNVVHKILGAKTCRQLKNLDIATAARQEGNKLFQKKKYAEALEQYNISVINAPAHRGEDREELTLSLANRSAVMFHLQKYQCCIDDIEYALEMGYHEKLQYKLYDRLGKCYIEMKDRANAVGHIKKAKECLVYSDLNEKGLELWRNSLHKQLHQAELIKSEERDETPRRRLLKCPPEIEPYNRNPKYPCSSTSFNVQYSPEKGRYACTKADIKVGEVLLVEKAYSSVLISEHVMTHCNHCMLRIQVPYPCMWCTSVRYCSPVCQHEAWDSYHYGECAILPWFTEECLGQMSFLAMRTILVSGIDKVLKNYMKEDNCKFSDNSDDVYEVCYETVWQLVGNTEKHTSEELFQMTVMAVLIVKLLQLTDFWPSSADISRSPDELLLSIGYSIIKLLCIIQCNAFNVAEMKMKDDFRLCKPVDIGLGLYPTSSLMNHSCCPNVDCNYYGGVIIYRAIQDIKADEEINIDYGMVFYSNHYTERQEKLSAQYYFKCQCLACVEDWPLAEELNSTIPDFLCCGCSARLGKVAMKERAVTCKRCGQSCDIGQYLQTLHQSQVTFVRAMSGVMQGLHHEALPILQKHLSLVQSYIAPPWRDFFSCQASIKQCYMIMGNTSSDYAL